MVIVNGKMQSRVEIDNSFYFGKGLFETILVLNNPIFLKEHLKRLNESLSLLNIDKKIDSFYIEKIIKKYKIRNKALKVLVTDKNIVITFRDIPYKKEQYEKGFSLRVSEVLRNSTSLLCYVKSVNYIENIIEKEKAKLDNYDEVLFLNQNLKVSEGSSFNIFFVKDKKIYTPKVECGLLNGIIRQWIINNYSVIEGEFDLSNVLESDEVFITNSLVGIMKINKINGTIFNKKNLEDNFTNKIYKHYLKEIGVTL